MPRHLLLTGDKVPCATQILNCSSLYSCEMASFPTTKDQSNYTPPTSAGRNRYNLWYILCGIFKALNANLLKIGGGEEESSLCKCETCKYLTPDPSCNHAAIEDRCAPTLGSGISCAQQGARGRSALPNPSPADSLPGCLGALASSGKSRSHWCLAPWAAAPRKANTKHLHADSLRVSVELNTSFSV